MKYQKQPKALKYNNLNNIGNTKLSDNQIIFANTFSDFHCFKDN